MKSILGKQLIINGNKFDWETLNTPKIKTVFYDDWWNGSNNDYGTKLRIKCHQRIRRKEKSIDGELCANWELLDSFGVRLEDSNDFNSSGNYSYDDNSKYSINHNDGYEKFYDDPTDGPWDWFAGNGL